MPSHLVSGLILEAARSQAGFVKDSLHAINQVRCLLEKRKAKNVSDDADISEFAKFSEDIIQILKIARAEASRMRIPPIELQQVAFGLLHACPKLMEEICPGSDFGLTLFARENCVLLPHQQNPTRICETVRLSRLDDDIVADFESLFACRRRLGKLSRHEI